MSHYIDLNFQFAVSEKKKTVTTILKSFCDKNRPTCKLPKHPFFKQDHWESIFLMERIPILTVCSYTKVDNYLVFHLQGSCPFGPDIIEDFVDWVAPYAKGAGIGIIGWSLYEEAKTPEFYYGDVD